MVKAVIFDMDGVIVDNRDVHIEAFEILCRRYGVSFDKSDLSWMYGKGNDSIIPGIFPPQMVERIGLKELSREKEAIYRDIYADHITPTRGLITLLEDLHRHSIPCAVGSSASRVNVDFVLEKCRLEDDFSVIVTGNMVQHRKPAPDIFILAAELLGYPPHECLVFEDSIAGIEAANAAGIPVVALATTLPRTKLQQVHHGTIIDNFAGVCYDTVKDIA